MSSLGLNVIEVSLLYYFDKRPINHELSKYLIEKYGEDYKEKLNNLFQNGYIAICSPEESLTALTIPELKNILRDNNQKLSGKKADLVARIKENVPLEYYEEKAPKLYKATDKGKTELDDNLIYLINESHGFGFMNNEIKAAKDEYMKNNGFYIMNDVLWGLFNKRTAQLAADGSWGLLRNNYLNMAYLLRDEQRDIQCLQFLLAVKYLDYSGMANNNTVDTYNDLKWVGKTCITKDIDSVLTKLAISVDDLDDHFNSAVKMAENLLPFKYFPNDVVLKIIKNELMGRQFNPKSYTSFKNIPNPNDSRYFYWNESEVNLKGPAIKNPSQTKARSPGCIMIILIIAFITYLFK